MTMKIFIGIALQSVQNIIYLNLLLVIRSGNAPLYAPQSDDIHQMINLAISLGAAGIPSPILSYPISLEGPEIYSKFYWT